MIEFIIKLDIQFFLFLNSLHADWMDQPMFWISETKPWIPFYIFLIYQMIRTLGKKVWLAILGIVLLIVITDRFTSGFMKPYFKRPRPSHEVSIDGKVHLVKEPNGNYYKGGSHGFASSHAANTFGLAMFLWLLFRKRWKYASLLFVWAFVVSYSRIYLGVHYPLDIIVGALVGFVTAWGLYRVYLLLMPGELKS